MLFVRLFDLRLFGVVCPLPLGVLDGLWFVIVALPGLFSYLFSELISLNVVYITMQSANLYVY